MTKHLVVYNGIDGLRGREPVGAVLRIGRRAPGSGKNRHPIDRDRFFIANPRRDGNEDRPLHPAFKGFNEAAPEHRRSVRGVIVHASESECFNSHLMNYRVKGTEVPDLRPFCVGDGVDATRWDGRDFTQIPCPHDRCQYRQGTIPACKPTMSILFQPTWQNDRLPTPLMEFSSKSWNTTSAFKGFFDHIRQQMAHLGVTDAASLFGFQFMMTLAEESKPSKGRKFPVVRPTPITAVQEFLLKQTEIRKAIAEGPRMSVIDEPVQDPQEVGARHFELSPGPATDGSK